MFANKDLCDRVLIFDTTLRDGEQTPGVRFTRREKVEIARQLDVLGVDVIEAGFAASSDGDLVAIQAVTDAVRRPVITSLARSVLSDIDAAWDAVKGAEHPRIHVFIPSSDVQITHQLRKNPEEVIVLRVRQLRARRAVVMMLNFQRWMRRVLMLRFCTRC